MDKGYMTAVESANAAKVARNAPRESELGRLLDDARRRVERSPRMRKSKDILLSASHADNEGYLRWVLLCNVAEIVAWAETIRRDSYADG